MREREREWRDRKKMKLWSLNYTAYFLCYTRISNPHSPNKIYYRLTLSQISSLKYAPVISCDVEESFSMYKNVRSDKRMTLNEDNLD